MGRTCIIVSLSDVTRRENDVKWSHFPLVLILLGFQLGGWTLKTLKSKVHQGKMAHRELRGVFKGFRPFIEPFLQRAPYQSPLTSVPIIIYMLITQLRVRAGVKACLCACLWGSRWQPHNSSHSTADGGVLLLCYKRDKSLNHGSLIVPWAPNTSACCEVIVTQRECTDSPRVSRNHMRPDGAHLLNSKPLQITDHLSTESRR